MSAMLKPPWEVSPALLERPRTLGPAWTRIVRGDRGCLYDVVSLVGLLVTGALAMMSALEWLAFEWVYAGIALWGTGFVLGTRNQMLSSKERRLQLSEAPVVLVTVLEAGSELFNPRETRKTGRALVLYGNEEGQARDPGLLMEVLQHIRDLEARDFEKAANLGAKLERLRSDDFCFEHLALDPEEVGHEGYWLTRMVVYEERLSPETLEPSSMFWAIANSDSAFIEQIPFDPGKSG